jgi:hypothetical protein
MKTARHSFVRKHSCTAPLGGVVVPPAIFSSSWFCALGTIACDGAARRRTVALPGRICGLVVTMSSAVRGARTQRDGPVAMRRSKPHGRPVSHDCRHSLLAVRAHARRLSTHTGDRQARRRARPESSHLLVRTALTGTQLEKRVRPLVAVAGPTPGKQSRTPPACTPDMAGTRSLSTETGSTGAWLPPISGRNRHHDVANEPVQ